MSNLKGSNDLQNEAMLNHFCTQHIDICRFLRILLRIFCFCVHIDEVVQAIYLLSCVHARKQHRLILRPSGNTNESPSMRLPH